MAQAQLNYSQQAAEVREPSRRPDFRVVSGAKSNTSRASASSLRTTFYVGLVCIILMAAFAGVRVYLAAQTSMSTIEAAKIRTELKNEYTTASKLELRESILAQPERIKAYAQVKLDMGPAQSVARIDIGEPQQTMIVADLPDTAFDNTPKNDGNANVVSKFFKSLFAPNEAGAGVVTQP